jgi:integrase
LRLKRAGLADGGYRFHDLRHTCLSRLVAAGADAKLVQAIAGHSNPLITLKRYAHVLDARVGEAADRRLQSISGGNVGSRDLSRERTS